MMVFLEVFPMFTIVPYLFLLTESAGLADPEKIVHCKKDSL